MQYLVYVMIVAFWIGVKLGSMTGHAPPAPRIEPHFDPIITKPIKRSISGMAWLVNDESKQSLPDNFY